MTTDKDRLIAALTAKPEAADDGYLTFRELMAALDLGDNKLRGLLHALSDAGQLECKRVPRRSITGDMQSVPGYRLSDGFPP